MSRFTHGAAVIGRGWVFRVWRLRLIWAPVPDPEVVAIEATEEKILKMTIRWGE